MHALIVEAMKKAAIGWLAPAGTDVAYPVWCLWIDDALYVVSGRDGGDGRDRSDEQSDGSDEQPAPGLASATAARVSARGDHGGRIVTWDAAVTRLDPGDPAWSATATALAGKRLNASGTVEALVEQWARQCVISRLVPATDNARPPETSPAG